MPVGTSPHIFRQKAVRADIQWAFALLKSYLHISGSCPIVYIILPQARSLSSSFQWRDLLKWLTCFQLTQWRGELSKPPPFWLLSVIILCVLVYFLFANANYELLMQLIFISHTYKQMILYLSLGSWWRTISSFGFDSHRCIRLLLPTPHWGSHGYARSESHTERTDRKAQH